MRMIESTLGEVELAAKQLMMRRRIKAKQLRVGIVVEQVMRTRGRGDQRSINGDKQVETRRWWQREPSHLRLMMRKATKHTLFLIGAFLSAVCTNLGDRQMDQPRDKAFLGGG